MSFFDTDFVIDLLREQRRGVVGPAHQKLEQLGETPVRLSVFVMGELGAGAARFHDPEEVQRGAIPIFSRQGDPQEWGKAGKRLWR